VVDGVAAPSDPLRLPDAGWLTAVMLSEAPLVVALPAGHPLAGRATLRLADLGDAGWIDAPDVAAPLAELREITETDGMPAVFRYDGTDTAALLALVAAGHGLTLLPATALRAAPDVVAVRLATPRIVHRTELLHGPVTAAAGILAGLLTAPG
jgi:DNA-binding transcriptional LysR family regulator